MPSPYFIVCTECGDKRCPKAKDHSIVCEANKGVGVSSGFSIQSALLSANRAKIKKELISTITGFLNLDWEPGYKETLKKAVDDAVAFLDVIPEDIALPQASVSLDSLDGIVSLRWGTDAATCWFDSIEGHRYSMREVHALTSHKQGIENLTSSAFPQDLKKHLDLAKEANKSKALTDPFNISLFQSLESNASKMYLYLKQIQKLKVFEEGDQLSQSQKEQLQSELDSLLTKIEN